MRSNIPLLFNLCYKHFKINNRLVSNDPQRSLLLWSSDENAHSINRFDGVILREVPSLQCKQLLVSLGLADHQVGNTFRSVKNTPSKKVSFHSRENKRPLAQSLARSLIPECSRSCLLSHKRVYAASRVANPFFPLGDAGPPGYDGLPGVMGNPGRDGATLLYANTNGAGCAQSAPRDHPECPLVHIFSNSCTSSCSLFMSVILCYSVCCLLLLLLLIYVPFLFSYYSSSSCFAISLLLLFRSRRPARTPGPEGIPGIPGHPGLGTIPGRPRRAR